MDFFYYFNMFLEVYLYVKFFCTKNIINVGILLFSTLILTLSLKRGLSGIGHCYDWLMSLHRKQYQRPLAIACKYFDNMIKIKMVISRQSIMKSFTCGL